MAHQPERPQEYVCEGCQNVVAGTVHGNPPDHDFEAPEQCAACGSTDFVELESYTTVEQT